MQDNFDKDINENEIN